jgi:hypothetical protein
VRHLQRTPEGWQVAESASFRIYHNQPREVVEKAAAAAEATRAEVLRRWFGELTAAAWNPPPEMYLHGTADAYSHATGIPANSPGHSTIRSDAGRVVSRRVDLHCDDPTMLTAVLPHETTHVVLAGRFGPHQVPRWVDEGIAVLSEPRERIDRHLRNLPAHQQQLFALRQLLELADYPQPRAVGVFYAQSVSVVEFLSREKGPQTFVRFVNDGLNGGYEQALRRHYGYQDFNDLEQHWRRHAFGQPATPPTVAGTTR